MLDRVQSALAAIPGVTGASAASALPLTATAFQTTITIPGAPGNTGDAERDKVLVDMIAVRAEYVEVMRMKLLAGRTFTESRQDGVTEAMIDTAIVGRFFSAGSALGSRIDWLVSVVSHPSATLAVAHNRRSVRR